MQRLLLVGINVVGGASVLGSYALGIAGHSGQADLLWGSIPASARGLYAANMPLAAAGYLLMFGYLVAAPAGSLRIGARPAMPLLSGLYAVFLATSTAWMPLCWQALDHGQAELLPLIQAVLLVAGLASAGLMGLLMRLTEPPRDRWRKAAVVGMGFLVLQCLVLDALIWPRFFGIPA